MTQLEKWQPKHKISTARNRKAREGYMNIGHHSGRQNLAHGVIEQMEKGDIEMSTNEQARLNNVAAQLEKSLDAIQKRGPVDKLTGGRVRFETNPAKKARPENSKPFLGVPGVEMHTTGRAARLHGALGGRETTPAKPEQKMAMSKAMISLQKVADGVLFIQKRGRSKEQQMAGLARAVDRPEDYAEQMRAREIYHEGGSIRGDEEYGPHAEAQKRGGSLTRARRSIRAAQMEGAAGDVEGHKDRILGEAERRARDHGIPIQNGVVDKLTGGRVKFETNRDKQVTDRGPKFLGVPSVEVQVKKPTMKMTRAMKMGAGYKKLEKSADGDCGCSD